MCEQPPVRVAEAPTITLTLTLTLTLALTLTLSSHQCGSQRRSVSTPRSAHGRLSSGAPIG